MKGDRLRQNMAVTKKPKSKKGDEAIKTAKLPYPRKVRDLSAIRYGISGLAHYF